MPLSPLPFREVKRRLETAGFAEGPQKGRHVKFVNSDPAGTRTAVVPRHREIPPGTLRSIFRQAGLSEEEFAVL